MTAIEAIKERRIAATIARFGCDRETAVEFLAEIGSGLWTFDIDDDGLRQVTQCHVDQMNAAVRILGCFRMRVKEAGEKFDAERANLLTMTKGAEHGGA